VVFAWLAFYVFFHTTRLSAVMKSFFFFFLSLRNFCWLLVPFSKAPIFSRLLRNVVVFSPGFSHKVPPLFGSRGITGAFCSPFLFSVFSFFPRLWPHTLSCSGVQAFPPLCDTPPQLCVVPVGWQLLFREHQNGTAYLWDDWCSFRLEPPLLDFVPSLVLYSLFFFFSFIQGNVVLFFS